MIEEQQQVKITTADLIYSQVKDLGKRMDRLEKNMDVTRQELNQRMDRIENRMDKLESRIEKQDEKIDKLADRIDALRRDLQTGSNHGQILTASVIGIAIAVIYSVIK